MASSQSQDLVLPNVSSALVDHWSRLGVVGLVRSSPSRMVEMFREYWLGLVVVQVVGRGKGIKRDKKETNPIRGRTP